MESYFIYVLRSISTGRFYVGMTQDVDKRLSQHNAGYVKSTSGYRPYELLAYEKFSDRVSARQREKFLKSGQGRAYLKQTIPT